MSKKWYFRADDIGNLSTEVQLAAAVTQTVLVLRQSIEFKSPLAVRVWQKDYTARNQAEEQSALVTALHISPDNARQDTVIVTYDTGQNELLPISDFDYLRNAYRRPSLSNAYNCGNELAILMYVPPKFNPSDYFKVITTRN